MRVALVAALLLSGCPESPKPAAKAPSAKTPAAKPAPQAPKKAPVVAKAPAVVPGADRVFAVPLAKGAEDSILGTDGDALWARSPADQPLWRVQGPGVVQRIAVGDYGRGYKLYVARGVGRGHLKAPLTLQELDPATGKGTTLWSFRGARTECAHLSIADVDRDGKPELAFAYYGSKYMVRTRHLEAGGAAIEGPETRMATGRLYADLDGDGKADEVIARVYGDAKGEPGDLKVNLGKGWVKVPTEQGVRGIVFAAIGAEKPALYFADGWVANYGKKAKARLKRASFAGGQPKVELLGQSAEEFTFFELDARDLDGDGALELLARGNKAISAFAPGAGGWQRRALISLAPVLNAAIARRKAGPVAWVPAKPKARVTKLKLN